MNKTPLFTIILIITVAIIFTTAITCNMCGKPVDINLEENEETETRSDQSQHEPTENQSSADEELPAEEEPPDTDITDDEEDTASTEEIAEEENHPPVIDSVFIGETELPASFPIFVNINSEKIFNVTVSDEDGDMLTYTNDCTCGSVSEIRVNDGEATFGWLSPEEPGHCTITIVVSDSKGAEDIFETTINVIDSSGEDLEAVPLGEEEIEISFSQPAFIDLCGYIIKDTAIWDGIGRVFVGDSSSNKMIKGYLSFDTGMFESLGTAEELLRSFSAELNLTDIYVVNDPDFAENLVIKHFNYGTLDFDDFEVGGTTLATIPTSSIEDTISVDVSDAVLSATAEGRNYFQLKLGLSSSGSNNGIEDGYWIDLEGATITITASGTISP